jgi:23S rRNA pseudouridine955/2504/2580 synthase
MIAKKRSALVELHRMLREGEIGKIYTAVVKGKVGKSQFEMKESLHKYVTSGGQRRVSVREDGKAAFTKVALVKANREISLLEVTLLTGRTHQIRVHLAHAGHPVLGDDKYGDFELNRAIAKQGVKRLFLHAGKLALVHPLTRERLRFDAALPQDMRAFVDRQFA